MPNLDFKHPVPIFFIGIGGISMSGLAHILLNAGFKVSGSDRNQSDMTESLKALGADVFIGHDAKNIAKDVLLVVYTAAIKEDNPEFIEAKARGIECMSRATLLGLIMKNYKNAVAVAGTHGKTTTTSMVSEILMNAGLDPTLSIGGVLNSIQSNVYVGHSDYFVTEACEYTNSFLSFFPKIAVILNIEEDHMDFFKDISQIRQSFRSFAELLPKDGALVINQNIENLDEIVHGLKCRVITYGLNADHADYSASQLDGITPRAPGTHNMENALAAKAVADFLGIPADKTKDALEKFSGSKRRFEKKGEICGVTIIDDYAHHPSEIKASLKLAKSLGYKKIWCVFQPHTYTRTLCFLNEFADSLSLADEVVLTDIYAAREVNIPGVSSNDICRILLEKGNNAHYYSSFEEIEKFLLKNCTNGDLLITMGAGDVYYIADDLLGLR